MAFFQSSITIHTIQLQVWYSAQKGEEKESEAGMKLARGNVVSPPIQDNITLACFVMMVHGTQKAWNKEIVNMSFVRIVLV